MNVFEMDLDEEIYFKESTIEFDLMHHKNQSLIDLYSQELFLEAAEGAPAKESKGVFQKIIDGIQAALKRIGDIIDGFMNAIRENKGNHLTPEEYMNSTAGKEALALDIALMRKDVDEEYLQMRKIVQKLSSATGLPAEDIAKFSDSVNEKVYNNRYKIKAGAKTAVRMTEVFALQKVLVEHMDEATQYKKKAEKTLADIEAREKALRGVAKDLTGKDLSLLDRFVNSLGHTIGKWAHMYTTIAGPMKKTKKTYNKNLKKEIKKDKKKNRKW